MITFLGIIVVVIGLIGIAASVVAWVLGEYYTGED